MRRTQPRVREVVVVGRELVPTCMIGRCVPSPAMTEVWVEEGRREESLLRFDAMCTAAPESRYQLEVLPEDEGPEVAPCRAAWSDAMS